MWLRILYAVERAVARSSTMGARVRPAMSSANLAATLLLTHWFSESHQWLIWKRQLWATIWAPRTRHNAIKCRAVLPTSCVWTGQQPHLCQHRPWRAQLTTPCERKHLKVVYECDRAQKIALRRVILRALGWKQRRGGGHGARTMLFECLQLNLRTPPDFATSSFSGLYQKRA